MENMEKHTRMINIELLRIISMLLIITLHALGHGGVLGRVSFDSLRGVFCWWLEGVAYATVNVYVLISGYFMVKSQFKVRKLLFLLVEVLFYSVFLYILFSYNSFQPLLFLKSCFPTTTSAYWFISVYVVMYCFSPFLNVAILNMNKKMHQICILSMLLFFCIWDKGSIVLWFICLYFVAAYIRLYYHNGTVKKRSLIVIYVLVTICMPLSRYCISHLTKMVLGEEFKVDYFYQNESILVFCASVLLLLIFIEVSVNSKILASIISMVSPLTLAVYLIHDNYYVREWIWKVVDYHYDDTSILFFLNLFIVILGIFVICSIIEWLRRKVFKVIRMDRLIERIALCFSKLYDKIL